MKSKKKKSHKFYQFHERQSHRHGSYTLELVSDLLGIAGIWNVSFEMASFLL